MPLNPDAVGRKGQPQRRSWTSKDSLLYALGVGAGTEELAFTTENTKDTPQRALPTMAVVLGGGGVPFGEIGTFNPALMLHGAQGIELLSEIPPEGEIESTGSDRRPLGQGRRKGRRCRAGLGICRRCDGKAAPANQDDGFLARRRGLRRRARPSAGMEPARSASRTTRFVMRPASINRSSTASLATAIRCTRIRLSPSSAASNAPFCTACAPTASRGGRCSTQSARATPPASRPWTHASPSPSCPATN